VYLVGLQDSDEVKFGPCTFGVTTNLAHTKIKFTLQLLVWTHYQLSHNCKVGWEIKLANRQTDRHDNFVYFVQNTQKM